MTKEQERARARRRHERQLKAMAQREADGARRKRVLAIIATVVAVLGGLAIAGSIFASEDPATEPTTSATTIAGCEQPPEILGTGAELELPDAATASGKTYVATMSTNCGDIELTLDGAKAPQAVASFVELAQRDYWRNAPCHRLTTSPTLSRTPLPTARTRGARSRWPARRTPTRATEASSSSSTATHPCPTPTGTPCSAR